MKRLLTLMALGALAAACGSGSVTRIEANAREFRFVPSEWSVPSEEEVVFTLIRSTIGSASGLIPNPVSSENGTIPTATIRDGAVPTSLAAASVSETPIWCAEKRSRK